jgi:hypothetical protein
VLACGSQHADQTDLAADLPLRKLKRVRTIRAMSLVESRPQ